MHLGSQAVIMNLAKATTEGRCGGAVGVGWVWGVLLMSRASAVAVLLGSSPP